MSSLDWEALKSFLAVAEDGSLSRAATRLDISVATLGRRIDELEAEIGFKVIRRGPRGTTTTPEGQRIADLIKPGAEYFGELDRLVRVMTKGIDRPPIRVSSTEPMIADVLAPRTPKLLSEHPHIKIEFETSLELSNLNRGEADIAVRMVKPSGETLITRRLPKIQIGLFAATSYLNTKSTKIDLQSESLLWYDSAYGDIAENLWLKRQKLEDQVVLRSGSVRALPGRPRRVRHCTLAKFFGEENRIGSDRWFPTPRSNPLDGIPPRHAPSPSTEECSRLDRGGLQRGHFGRINQRDGLAERQSRPLSQTKSIRPISRLLHTPGHAH
ncbi:MAG: LysR family transcriptional regulator [Pseudomonadota bacterium]